MEQTYPQRLSADPCAGRRPLATDKLALICARRSAVAQIGNQSRLSQIDRMRKEFIESGFPENQIITIDTVQVGTKGPGTRPGRRLILGDRGYDFNDPQHGRDDIQTFRRELNLTAEYLRSQIYDRVLPDRQAISRRRLLGNRATDVDDSPQE